MKQEKLKQIILTISCCIVLVIAITLIYHFDSQNVVDLNIALANNNANNEFIYLSDIDYIASESKSGWGSLLKDKTSSNTKISVKVEGSAYSFEKGMWAHASSVLVYDISGYNYDYFTSYIGINTTSSKGNGVIYKIYTSMDGKNWEKVEEKAQMPGANATYIKIEIKGKKYLKLEADANGANGNDHSVYADAKLIKEGYGEELEEIDIEKYDEKIKGYGEIDLTNKEQELTVLQRDLIKNMGPYAIKRFIGESEANKKAFEWLFNDVENLRLYTMGGKPTGTYYNSLNVLKRILEKHQRDFDIEEKTKYGTRLGDLYKRMAITLSLTHSAQVALWMQPGAPENQSDAVTRYEIYKELHKNNKFRVTDSIDITKWFENYNIEEMRFVMNNLIDDESIIWLNEYVQSKIDANPKSAWSLLTPHPYMAYVWPSYGNPVYYAEENYDYFNELFSVNGKKLYDYGITRGTADYKVYKVWMNFRNKFGTGAVCGGISKTGSNIRATHGIPAAVIGQPGHAAIIYYTQDAEGRGYWNLDNDVSGWTLSEKGERMLLGWGNASYQRGYSVVYMALSQEVLNDYEKFESSQKKVILADVYQEDLAKRERIYREALEIQPLNINAWYGLILTYNENPNKTEDEYYELAKEIGENLKYFPLPMQHLTNLIKPKLTSIENSYKFTLLQTRILTEGSKTPNNTEENYYVYQPSLTRLEANYLLGKLDKTIATFSFDGEEAGKIVLSSRFDNTGVRWDYSIDGGENWKEVSFAAEEEHKLQLTEEEIARINAEDDIKIHIVGVNYEEENIYNIDITKAATPTNLFGNDLENRVIGVNTTYEWRRNENEAWTSYQEASPDNTGNKSLQVRIGATGTSLPSDVLEFNFTEDNQPETRKYVSISHLSIHAVSSQATAQGRHATNAIDGNYNTNWHSAWNGSDTERYITIKLDKPRYISAVEYVPGGGGNGKILDGTVYGSLDGENWEVLSEMKNIRYTNQANTNEEAIENTKSFEIENPKEVQYVKIVADRASNGNWIMARAFNLFQDMTINPRPTAGVGYDKTERTNQNVIARLINPSTEITITNNNGSDTYVFTENGEFTFEFVDKNGNIGTSTAVVNWIDKIAPTATIEYSTTNPINRDVIARLIPNEPIIVLNNGSLDLSDPNKDPLTYTFAENGEFTFEFQDLAGNIGTATAKVSWIDKEAPVPIVIYDKMELTNEDVTVTLEFEKENVRITNNNGSNTYTFTENGEFTFNYVDAAGNIGSTKVEVNWIDKVVPIATIEYNKTELTNEDVMAIIKFNKSNVQITNNEGKNTYVFTENGEFVFEFKDKAGNIGTATAKVSWIDKELPNVRIEYSTTERTNQDVIAKVVANKDIVITNNSSNTYTFKENGEFTFNYKDKAGNTGSIKAVVNWIDKVSPTAMIKYNITELTNEDVIAEIIPSEEIVLLNNEGKNTYVFTENGEFTFEFRDLAGNTGTATAKVSWIDKVKPNGSLTYDKTELTNQDVTVSITFDKSNVTILNNEGKNTYTFTENGEFTFEFQDAIGNYNTATAKVSWIDKETPVVKINYSNLSTTRDPVTVTIECDKEIKITNNNGSNTYTFTENGEFTFEFVDLAGNIGTATAKVDWINKNIANSIISYDKREITNQDVIVTIEFDKENVIITNNNGSNTYTFTENGEFTFEYCDAAGNVGRAIAKVDWIDKTAPTGEMKYNITELTNQDVVVELIPSEKVTITNNNGSNTYTFTENGEFTFEFEDLAGNTGIAIAKVSWIDKVTPNATISYDKMELTNEDVSATITFDKENVTILNNEGKDTYVFTENGEFTFEYRDAAGNTGTATSKVSWIDKTAPTGKIKYSITKLTNQDVEAEIIPNEEVTILNNNGLTTYTFKENGIFVFELKDRAGNIGYVEAKVNWIDKQAPTARIKYNTNSLTNQNVVAEIVADENITVMNNEGKKTYTFTENGEFTFEYQDDLGNKGQVTARVDWIDKVAPNGILTYDINGITNQNVTVSINFDKENVIITNNAGKNTYTFTENGEFTFEYQDAAGNINTTTAKVDWINKNLPTPTISYNIDRLTNQSVKATITFDKENVVITNNNGLNTYTFEENGSFIFEYRDEAGNIGTAKATVCWIDKVAPVATITFDKNELTNEDVKATITFNKENVVVINNQGLNAYIFKENGEFTFEYRDEAGNTGTAIALVDWIDKVSPTATITYDKNELTNEDVTATITFDKEDVVITNNEGKNTYIFTENGEFVFEYQDKAGNIGTATAKVDWIQKEYPNATISYDIQTLTNQSVTATIHLKDGVYVTNNEGKNTYTFIENGEFVFEYQDEAGNIGTIKAHVTWIDKVVPKATIIYDKTEKTTENVIAMVTFDKENVVITNNNGSNKYNFTENGEFTFEYKDKAGNVGIITASVSWIEKKVEKPIIIPEKRPENQIIINNNPIFDYSDQKNETKYTNYAITNIKASILTSDVLDHTKLKKANLTLPEELKQQLGEQAEYFEIYIEDYTGNKISVNSEDVKLIFNINKNKELNGIYIVKEDNTYEKVNYKLLGSDQVECNVKTLGKFLISYKEDQKQDKKEIKEETKSKSNIIWYIASAIVLGLGVILAIMKKRGKI